MQSKAVHIYNTSVCIGEDLNGGGRSLKYESTYAKNKT